MLSFVAILPRVSGSAKRPMGDTAAQFSYPLGPYIGFVIGAAALGAVLVLNQFIYHWRWKTYRSLRHEGRRDGRERQRPHLPLPVRNRTPVFASKKMKFLVGPD
jgi:hypothetical protein